MKATIPPMTIRDLAEVTGIHRQTISKRLAAVEPLPGSSSKRKFYELKTALREIYKGAQWLSR